MPDTCVPDHGVRSIPALAQWAAARYGDAEAVVDGTTRLTFREVAALARRATRGAMAQGIEPGDRVAIWAPNSWEWIVAALGALGAGAWLVPVNTRFKGDEAAYVLDRSGVPSRCSPCAGSSTPTTSPSSAMPRPTCACLDHLVLLAGARGDEATLDDFLAAGDAVDDADALGSHRRARARRRRRRDLHVGHHRPTQGRDARARRVARARSTCGPGGSGCARATATSWSTRSSTASATRRDGWRACSRAPLRCRWPPSTSTGSSSWWPPSACRRCPGHRRCSPRCSTRGGGDADLRSLRIGFVGASTVRARAAAPDPGRPAVRVAHHRVRPHREHRHGVDHPPRRRSGTRGVLERRLPARRHRGGDRTGRRDPRARLQRDARLLRRSRGDRRGRSTPTAGSTPATSASASARRRPAHLGPQEGHLHLWRLQRLARRGREPPPAVGRHLAGRGGRHPGRPLGRGRRGVRRAPLRRIAQRRRRDRVGARAHRELQGAAPGGDRHAHCRSTRAARCSRASCARMARAHGAGARAHDPGRPSGSTSPRRWATASRSR